MTLKITDEVLESIEQLAAQGLNQDQIATSIGCSVDTLMRRKKDNADFATYIKRGQTKGIENVTNALYDKAMEGDNVAMIFFLKNRDSDNWADSKQVNIKTEREKMSEDELLVELDRVRLKNDEARESLH